MRCIAHIGFDHRKGQQWQERYYRDPPQCMREATKHVGDRDQYAVCWQHAKEYELKGCIP